MALEVAEGAVVRDDLLEAVAERLKAATGAGGAGSTIPTIAPSSSARSLRSRTSILARHSVSARLAASSRQGGEEILFATVDADQSTEGRSAAVEPEPRHPTLGVLTAVSRSRNSTRRRVGALDPADEARHHPLQLAENHPP